MSILDVFRRPRNQRTPSQNSRRRYTYRKMSFEPLEARELLAADLELFANVGFSDALQFHVVELDSAQASEQSLGYAGFNTGLDAQPNSNLLYAGYSSLKEVDPSSGRIRTVGNFHTDSQSYIGMKSLSFAPNGTLYGVSSNTLYTIDTGTAQATAIAAINTESASDNVFGIEFSTDGTLYAAGFQLMTLNRETAQIESRIGRLDNYVTELDFAADGKLYGVLGSSIHEGEIVEIDLESAAQTVVSTFPSDLNGIATRADADGVDVPANTSPEARDDSLTLSEDSFATVNVLANDVDLDGDALRVADTTQGANGSVSVEQDGTIRYTPDAEFFGSDQFSYTIEDGRGGHATATVDVTVTPTADSSSTTDFRLFVGTGYDSPSQFSLVELGTEDLGENPVGYSGFLGSLDVDPISGRLLAVSGSKLQIVSPTDGTREAIGYLHTESGDTLWMTSISFAPNGELYGVSSHTLYTIDTETAVAKQVGPSSGKYIWGIEFAPDGTLYGGAFELFTIDPATGVVTSKIGTLNDYVLDLDFAPDGTLYAVPGASRQDGFITQIDVTDASQKRIGSFESEDFYGISSFPVTGSSTDAAPEAQDDVLVVAEDASATVDVRANDVDPVGAGLQVTAVTQGSHGLIQIAESGNLRYTPEADFHGSDAFTYTLVDGRGQQASGTVHVTVESVNDAPVAQDATFTATEDTRLTVEASALASKVSDIEGDALQFSLSTSAAHGLVTLSPDGSLEYVPDADFYGTDTFAYRATDPHGAAQSATVTIMVSPVNDTPMASADEYAVSRHGIFGYATVLAKGTDEGLLANDVDADGDALTVSLVDGPKHGALTLNADGSFVYEPAGNYVGTDTFTYRASDDVDESALTTVSVAVGAVPADTVFISGTDGRDVVTVLQEGDSIVVRSKLNGSDVVNTRLYPRNDYTRVVFLGGGENDNFIVGVDGITVDAYGGKGNDSLTQLSTTAATAVSFYGGDGGDRLRVGGSPTTLYSLLDGGRGNDFLYSGGSNDVLTGGSGSDFFYFDDNTAQHGRDVIIDNASDNNEIDFSKFQGGVVLDLSRTDVQVVNSSLLRLQLQSVDAIRSVIGSAFNDDIIGNERDNFIYGGDGDDDIRGGFGDDFLSAGAGGSAVNFLRGNEGDDTLVGGPGDDFLSGGTGSDTYQFIGGDQGSDVIVDQKEAFGKNTIDYSLFSGPVTVDLAYAGASVFQTVNPLYQSLEISVGNSINNVIGTPYDDKIYGNDLFNHLEGRGGNDWLYGRGGYDELWGGPGNDGLFAGVDYFSNQHLGVYGEEGMDRFLVVPDPVGHSSDIPKTERTFDATKEDAIIWFRNNYKDALNPWTDREVEVIDAGFGVVHNEVGNVEPFDEFDRPSPNGYLTLPRSVFKYDVPAEVDFNDPTNQYAGFNRGGLIFVRDWDESSIGSAFSSADHDRASTAVHELAHNFDECGVNPLWEGFEKVRDDGTPSRVYEGDTYGSTNAKEDWARSWQVYFDGQLSQTVGHAYSDPFMTNTRRKLLDEFFAWLGKQDDPSRGEFL